MYSNLRSAALLSCSILAISAATAGAQDLAQPIVLDEIALTATTDASVEPDGFVSGYAQAATKSDTPVAEMQQSVSVVTTSQIEQQGADSLGEALSYSSGVVGQPFGADPRFNAPTIRGFSVHPAFTMAFGTGCDWRFSSASRSRLKAAYSGSPLLTEITTSETSGGRWRSGGWSSWWLLGELHRPSADTFAPARRLINSIST